MNIFLKISAILLFTIIISVSSTALAPQTDEIIDSSMNLNEALSGLKFPGNIRKDLVLVDVHYYSFDGNLHKGQIVVHKSLENDIADIFNYIREIKYPVNKVVPICRYNWSDSLSILDNNTSGFNYRFVERTKVLSMHAKGRAIDLNPYINPQILPGASPESHRPYIPSKPGTLTRKSPVVEFFLEKGWKWGGSWKSMKDYQHFEK